LKQLADGPDARRLLVLFLLLFGMAVLADCAVFRRHTGNSHTSTVIHVRNDNWLDMKIYLVRNGDRERLGTVGSFNEAMFQVETSRLRANDIRLFAAPIGSNATYLSPSIIVSQGQLVRLEIKNALSLSTVAVY
jgi:hypothetical protein